MIYPPELEFPVENPTRVQVKSGIMSEMLCNHEGIGIGIFNDNVDENQSTTNHHGIHFQ